MESFLTRFAEEVVPSLKGDLGLFIPELTLMGGACVVLLADLLVEREKSRWLAWPALASCLLALAYTMKGWAHPDTLLFRGMLAFDPYGNFFKLLLVGGTVPVIILSAIAKELQGIKVGEYYAILLGSLAGAMMMACSTNLLMIYLAMELLSLSSYVLVGYRKGDRRASEASLKYVIYGGVASGFMIYGFSLIWGFTGSLELRAVGQFLASGEDPLVVAIPVVFVFAGFAYKMAAVPMHFWCPDVYEGAPTPITAYLSVISKAGGFAVAMRFFHDLSPSGFDWPLALAVVSALTMTLGNLAALFQDNLKRMLAYSSIAHAGYMLMGVVVLDVDASLFGYPFTGFQAVAFYLLAYLAMNLGAFAVIVLVENRLGSVDIEYYLGLGTRAPALSSAFSWFLVSLVGIPPAAGSVAKVFIFAVAIKGGFLWLAVVAVVNTVVSVYYYARVLRSMWLETGIDMNPIRTPLAGSLVVGVLSAAVLAIFLAAGAFLDWTLALRLV